MNLSIRLFSVISRTLVGGGLYPSAEMQSVYSTVPADWAKSEREKEHDASEKGKEEES